MDFVLTVLAWFAMIASTLSAVLYPISHDIELVHNEKMRKFKIAWLRTALEALIVVLLSLRVLGKI